MNKLTKSEKKVQRDEAIARLRQRIKPGDEIYLVATEWSKRSCWTAYSVMIPTRTKRDGKWVLEIETICHDVAVALDLQRTSDGGVKSYGWGLSRSFEIVYNLGRVLFPDGFIPAKAGRGGRNGAPPTRRDTDGGYALVERLL